MDVVVVIEVVEGVVIEFGVGEVVVVIEVEVVAVFVLG